MTPPTMSLSSKELPIDSAGRRDSGVVASILQAGPGFYTCRGEGGNLVFCVLP